MSVRHERNRDHQTFGGPGAVADVAVGLGVDTSNATRAPGLYARHGMVLHSAVDTWEAILR